MATSQRRIEDFLKFMPRGGFEYHVHISTVNSYIYFEVPKVACSTTKFKLQQLEAITRGLPSVSDATASIHNKQQSLLLSPSDIGFERFSQMLDDSSILKFAFVRNPYTRVLSAFLNKIQWQASTHRQAITEILGVSIDSKVTFKQFLTAIEQQSSFDMNPHWRIQSDQLFHELIEFNFIGYFENFESDLQTALNKILSHTSRSKTLDLEEIYAIDTKGDRTDSNQKIALFYDLESQKMVQQIYEADFKNFDYSPKLNQD